MVFLLVVVFVLLLCCELVGGFVLLWCGVVSLGAVVLVGLCAGVVVLF
jgi:hypothetical protein